MLYEAGSNEETELSTSNRGHLVKETGYKGTERTRGKKEGTLQKEQKEGIFPEIRKPLWSWARSCELALGTALPEMLLLALTLQPLDPCFPPNPNPT